MNNEAALLMEGYFALLYFVQDDFMNKLLDFGGAAIRQAKSFIHTLVRRMVAPEIAFDCI